jgi:murein DD-endopeptidase MepM/ murein hydrolase activator NlpD
VGKVGNSGTSLVPHLHVAFGFNDQNDRYWSLPIKWENWQYRNLLPYHTGYEYGEYHSKNYGFPQKNMHVLMQ